ncbi:NADP-dependent oxidoreductase [Pseudomonas saliphila]|uniref:NADP-dependent oxidoreductase n=1 Tax=Pseudomonas saliphila TaxID=2586906 RepID=UPI0012391BA6|nr:NADP-dependent oxidoreductase [Pseudomonas saliphila]
MPQPTTQRRLILERRPQGIATNEDVVLREQPVGDLAEGQIMVRNHFFSVDPAIRDWMSERPSYLPPIRIGDPVRSTVIGEVVASRVSSLRPGQLVVGLGGWEEYSIAEAAYFSPVELQPGDQEQFYLSIYGAVGLTPYFGLIEVGKPQPGETVLVSAAAGAVGSLVGQIAKIKGCRAVGIAGSDEKCRWIVDELGFDAAINYRTGTDMVASIGRACPQGVDVYFDNVGGDILDATLLNLNKDARIVFCGAIASYNSTEPVPGPYNFWQILARSATIEGFLISDYLEQFPDGIAQIREWVEAGRLQFKEQIVDGLENTLDAFNLLFEGRNEGKLIVRVTS